MKHTSASAILRPVYFLFSVFSFFVQVSFAQECDECSHPRVAFYDCNVQVARPASADSIIAWQNLFWPSASARGYMHTNDSQKDCVSWLDGALINAAELQGGTLKFGPEYANLAPDGPVRSSDYLIRSTVEPAEGGFIFTLILEASLTRETVKSIQVQFNSTIESADAAGRQAAQAMMPLKQTIMQWEIDKRSKDVKIAISDMWNRNTKDVITVKPEKTLVDTGETINIEITMIDCDGVPLGGREIFFNDTTVYWNEGAAEFPLNGTRGGKITPRVAVTDGSGKATVKFKAANTTGTAEIICWYPHFKPCGRADAFQGTSMVQIKIPPTKLWLFKASITKTHTMHQDTVTSFTAGQYTDATESSANFETRVSGKVTAIIENLADDPVNDFSFNTEIAEPIALVYSGTGLMNEYSKNRETINGTLITADIRSDNVSGLANGADFSFEYSADFKYMGFGVSILAPGSYRGHYYGYVGTGWADYGGEYDNYGLGASAGFYSDDANGSINKTDSGYSGYWEFTENKQELNPGGVKYSTANTSVNITVEPYKSVTGIKKNDSDQLNPCEFLLGQNYPNPFNPTTSITYSVKERTNVSLVVYNILGKEIARLIDAVKPQGTYYTTWNAAGLSSGVYFYRLIAGNFVQTKKMILLR